MQSMTRRMHHVMGWGFSVLLLVGCQDMLGDTTREASQTQAAEQDGQVTAQQGIAQETQSTEPSNHDKAGATETKSTEALPTCEPKGTGEKPVEKPEEKPIDKPVIKEEPKTTTEPTLTEKCLELKTLIASAGADSPKLPAYLESYQAHCAEAKPVEKPMVKEEPQVSEWHPDVLDTVGVCKEVIAQLNSPEVFANTELYAKVKNRFGELNCFAVAGTLQPATPPKVPTQEEVCHNLKSAMEMMATESPKYLSYLAEYQAHCVEVK